jgi:2-methylaconitate cis-trans-isomerase PrpF
VTSGLLPTGQVIETIEIDGRAFDMSLVDASNPVAFVAANDVGLAGSEHPDTIETDRAVMALLDRLRRAAAVRMGLGQTLDSVGLANPKVAVVSAPATFVTLDGRTVEGAAQDIAIRMLSMERAHRAVTLTGAMCLAVACRIEGSLPHRLCSGHADMQAIRVAHPSGIVEAGATVFQRGNGWHVESGRVYRTARRLMQGEVALAPFEGEGDR